MKSRIALITLGIENLEASLAVSRPMNDSGLTMTNGHVKGAARRHRSGEGVDTFALNDVQQLQRRAARPLLANFPLLNG